MAFSVILLALFNIFIFGNDPNDIADSMEDLSVCEEFAGVVAFETVGGLILLDCWELELIDGIFIDGRLNLFILSV